MKVPDRFRFWRWPVLSIGVGVALLAFLPLTVSSAKDAVQMQSDLSSGRFCEGGEHCLQRVTGTLEQWDDGLSKHDPTPTWDLAAYGLFDVSHAVSHDLEQYQGATVVGLVWNGNVEAITSGDGGVFESLDVGTDGVLSAVLYASIILSFGSILILRGVVARRVGSSWFATVKLGSALQDSVTFFALVTPFVAACTSGIALWWGGPPWLVITLFALTSAVGGYAVIVARRPGRGRRIMRAG